MISTEVLATLDPFVDVRVYSTPVTQGSKKAFVVGPKSGPKEAFRAVVTESAGEGLKRFREAVRSETAASLPRPWTPVSGPIAAVLVFALPKPASAPKRRRTWPVKERSGDVDKLTRAVLDALTDAKAWVDDAACTELHVSKDYPSVEMDTPGVWIQLFDLAPVYSPEPIPEPARRDTMVDTPVLPGL